MTQASQEDAGRSDVFLAAITTRGHLGMSHIANVELEIKDVGSLKAACEELGLTFHEGQTTYKWWGKLQPDVLANRSRYEAQSGILLEDWGKCEHAISVSNGDYQIGVVRKRDGKLALHYDGWSSPYTVGGKPIIEMLGVGLEKLKQQYAVKVATKAMKKKGFRVVNKVEGGKIRLVCTR